MLYSKTIHYLSEEETWKLSEFLRTEFGLDNIVSIVAKPNQYTEIETMNTYKTEHSIERFRKFAEEYNKNYERK